MSAAIAGIIGAALYWVRGRGWPWGTTVNRLIWGIPTGLLIGFLSGAPLYLVPVLMLTSTLALIVTGHSAHMGAYRSIPTPGDGEWSETATHWWLPSIINRERHLALYNAVGLTAIGLMRLLVMILPLLWFDLYSLLLLLAAPFHTVSYFVGWYVFDRTGRSEPLAWCELLWGYTQWAAIALCFGLTLGI